MNFHGLILLFISFGLAIYTAGNSLATIAFILAIIASFAQKRQRRQQGETHMIAGLKRSMIYLGFAARAADRSLYP